MPQLNANDFFADLRPDPEFAKWADEQPKATESLPYMTGRQIMHAQVPPREDILGDAILFMHGIFALVAPPGTGKTRFAIQVACSSIAGEAVGHLACPPKPRRWAIVAGNENSVNRYKADLRAMLHHFPAEFHDAILDNLFFHVVDGFGDFMAPDSFDRIKAFVAEVQAEVVVLDPLGDLITGDANADVDMRQTLRAIARAVWGASPNAAIWIIHHARDGRINVAQAVGWDKGNYGKGSKALRAACRAVVNLAPMDKEGTGNIVVACGKCNDAPEFDTFGMALKEGAYILDPTFDAEKWVADVDGKKSGTRFSHQDLVNHLSKHPEASYGDIGQAFGVDKATVSRRVKSAIKLRFLKTKGKNLEITGKLAPKFTVEHEDESF